MRIILLVALAFITQACCIAMNVDEFFGLRVGCKIKFDVYIDHSTWREPYKITKIEKERRSRESFFLYACVMFSVALVPILLHIS